MKMEFQILWFILWGLLWAIYFALDGFDLGAGILYPVLTRNEKEKGIVLHSIGPVWNGNEVWLITAGGATFAAFPATYAYLFSYLYLPLLIILFGLILRGVSVEFRGKSSSNLQKRFWDAGITIGSLIPAFFLGVAFGNIFMGLKFDGSGYHGTILTLLNLYGLITGLLFLSTFIVHGGLWISIRSQGDISENSLSVSRVVWYIQLIIFVVFLILTAMYTSLYNNFIRMFVWFIVPLISVVSILLTGIYIMKNKAVNAFIFSILFILSFIFTGIIGLYPNLIPSSVNPEFNLTIFNSSSSIYTLKVMTVVVMLFIPVVIFYQIWVYKTFFYKISEKDLEGKNY